MFDRIGYRVLRKTSLNRFQAIPEALLMLRDRGFLPAKVVDCGANVGEFALAASRVFPAAQLHVIEPQPACLPILEAVAAERSWVVHAVAVGSSDGIVRLAVDPAGVSTGSHVIVNDDDPNTYPSLEVPLARLDELGLGLQDGDRALLKLDLQGWELEALRGAVTTLQHVEVILCEVSFFAQAKEPAIADLVQFLANLEFELYDVASLSGRRRDGRAHQADLLFAKSGSPITEDKSWH